MSNFNINIYLKVSVFILILCLFGFPTLFLFGRYKTTLIIGCILIIYLALMIIPLLNNSKNALYRKEFYNQNTRTLEKYKRTEEDYTFLHIFANTHFLTLILTLIYTTISFIIVLNKFLNN